MDVRKIIRSLPPYSPTIAVVAAIAWLTLAPHPLPAEADLEIPGLDKVVHAIMFGALMWVLELDTLRRDGAPARLGRGTVIAMAVASVMAGGAVELAQDAMDLGRGASLADWLADTVGVLLAAWLAPSTISWLLRRQP